MSYNESYWNQSPSATENGTIEQAHYSPGHPYWLEEVLISAGALVLILILAIIGIKNPDLAQRLLRLSQDFLSMMRERVRNRGNGTPPLPPPRNGVPRNFTDDEIIEMRERDQNNNGHYDAPARSVWI